MKPTLSTLPAERAAAWISAASAAFRPIGFSHSTCLPAARAAMEIGARNLLLVHTATTSTASSVTAASQLVVWRAPCRRASSFARVSSMSATTSSRDWLAADAARLLPTSPAPMTATPRLRFVAQLPDRERV